jgi:DNA/RNA-binding domain of Phe-tRNA-synthetase-like protein
MKLIRINNELKDACPRLCLGCIEADVEVTSPSNELLAQMNEKIRQLASTIPIEQIRKIPAIAASRRAYKTCGKDPARYRLSAEALLRRVVSGKGLYQINNVVDQLNLVSVSTGYSIGGYDTGFIQGDIVFGIGRAGEPYSGIGRGELNIEFLPVFRDDIGAFGTPTSDSMRTEVSEKTTRFLMIIIDFEGDDTLPEALNMAVHLLKKYGAAQNIEVETIQ